MATCPVCETPLRSAPTARGAESDATSYECDLCGKFRLSGTAVTTVPASLKKEPDKRPVVSHMLREMQRTETSPLMSSATAKNILKFATLPTPKEQADKFVRWLAENSVEPGDSKPVGGLLPAGTAIVGARSKTGFNFVIQSLIDQGVLKSRQNPFLISLSFLGWERYEELKRGSESGRNAFMAMKFDRALRSVIDEHFRPAVTETGFTLRLLDDEPRAGLIDDRLRVEIQAARFLIADLTHDNSGAYWEAGYAEGLNKPVIYTCRRDVFEGVGTHFDTNHSLTIPWSEASLPDDLKMLKATIRATIPEAKKTDD